MFPIAIQSYILIHLSICLGHWARTGHEHGHGWDWAQIRHGHGQVGHNVTSDGSDRLLLEIWLLEKISNTDIFFFWVEKYFAVVFIIVFFFPPFLFFLGTIFLVWTKQFHFMGPIQVLFFFHFFYIEIFDRWSRVPTNIYIYIYSKGTMKLPPKSIPSSMQIDTLEAPRLLAADHPSLYWVWHCSFLPTKIY
jgi:hypothetical protein